MRVASLGLVALLAACSSKPKATPEPQRDAGLTLALDVPTADNGQPLPNGIVPLVGVYGDQVRIDDRVVGSTATIADNRSGYLDGIYEAFKRDAGAPREVLFAFDRKERASVVVTMLYSAAVAGVPSLGLAVRARDGHVVRLEAGFRAPKPPPEPPPDAGGSIFFDIDARPTLAIGVWPGRYETSWQEGLKQTAEPVPTTTLAALGAEIEKEWQAHGVHRSDAERDPAALVPHGLVRYEEVVGVLDALLATKRDGPTGRIPAFEPRLSHMFLDPEPLTPEAYRKLLANSVRHAGGFCSAESTKGLLALSVTAAADGKVTGVTVGKKSTVPAKVSGCVVRHLERNFVPGPDKGAEGVPVPVEVTFPVPVISPAKLGLPRSSP